MAEVRIVAIIFDLDGTLLDTESATGGILRDFLAKYGKVLDPEKEMKRLGLMHKESAKAIVQDYELPMTSEEYSMAIMPIYEQRWSQAHPLPGVNRLIRHLHKHGIPLGLASNSMKRHIITKISHQQGWKEMFSVIIGSDEVSHGKPSPDIFLEAAQKLGTDASSCLVIEDSPVGVRAAKDAGATVIAVPSLQNQFGSYLIANHILHSLLEFQPELWGLPPFEDWIKNAIRIEPLLARGGLIHETVAQNCCAILMVDPDDGSFDALPGQVSGVFLGWAKIQMQGIFKMVASVSWDYSSGISERTIKLRISDELGNLDKKTAHLIFIGYIRKLLDEEKLLEAYVPTKEDASIAWAALDLPEFSKDSASVDEIPLLS